MVLCTDVAPVIDNSFGCCDLLQRSVIHYGAGRKASSAIISTPHQGVTTGTVWRVFILRLFRRDRRSTRQSAQSARPHGSAAPNSNAPASDVIAPPSKAATTAPRFYPGQKSNSSVVTLCQHHLARPRIGKKLFSQNNFRGFGAPMRYLD